MIPETNKIRPSFHETIYLTQMCVLVRRLVSVHVERLHEGGGVSYSVDLSPIPNFPEQFH